MPNRYTVHPKTTEERFWAKVDKNGPLWNGTPCWIWTAAKLREGYGHFWVSPRLVRAHRFAYELLVGPIPATLTLDHLCRNPPCVNPLHLEAVSNKVNILRGTGFIAIQARLTHCPQGHPYDLFNTYIWRGARACRTCQKLRDQERTRYPHAVNGP